MDKILLRFFQWASDWIQVRMGMHSFMVGKIFLMITLGLVLCMHLIEIRAGEFGFIEAVIICVSLIYVRFQVRLINAYEHDCLRGLSPNKGEQGLARVRWFVLFILFVASVRAIFFGAYDGLQPYQVSSYNISLAANCSYLLSLYFASCTPLFPRD